MISGKIIFALTLLFVVNLSIAQSKLNIGIACQLKKGFIYAENDHSNFPAKYSYSTGYISPQLDFIGSYQYNARWTIYSGLSLGFNSHICEFKYSQSSNALQQNFKTKNRSIKLPIKFGYKISERVELLAGVGINFNKVRAASTYWEFSLSNKNDYESVFIAPFEKFVTGSGILGFQYATKGRIKLFALMDFEFGKYPEVKITNKFEANPNSSGEVYYNNYKPQLFMLSLGMYMRIWKL